MDSESKIFVAGHNGLVGSAIVRLFKKKNFKNIITRNRKKPKCKVNRIVRNDSNEFCVWILFC